MRRTAGPSCSRGSSKTAWPDTKEHTTLLSKETSRQLQQVLAQRELAIVFQPIFGFAEGAIVGHEALVRGPEGSLLESPGDLFAAAAAEGRSVDLNVICIQEVLRAFSRMSLPGALFLNVSPQLIERSGFVQDRARRFMGALGLEPERVVIELTEDYPASDFRQVREALQLYRALGLRVAIDDLGEGFASLRLWSELKPEFVKADKHFVTGVARDPMKAQFLRAIQQIAEHCGAQVIAEGIEGTEDFRVVKDIGIACAQGFFIGRPSADPPRALAPDLANASADPRVPVVPSARFQAQSEVTAERFLLTVDAEAPARPLGALLARFTAMPNLAAIPVLGGEGIQGVVSRSWLDHVAMLGDGEVLKLRPCADFMDPAPIRVESDLELAALAAILVESDARRFADGFIVTTRGRYRGMGRGQDVMRALQEAQLLAARYTSPLTLLPGQVPINGHVERLLAKQVPFAAWFVEIDRMRGLNDGEGFTKGDALIHGVARLLESACERGLDFVGHVAGGRFVVLMQSQDWRARAEHVLEYFPALVATQVAADVVSRGYFVLRSRDGREQVRPLPKLAIGILPVLPGLFESRHDVLLTAKLATRAALEQPTSAIHIDERHANAYPASMLLSGDVP